jgi:GntR family transcriptional regulator/MocR family aminotransferase
VSRNTVLEAYDQLHAEGYLTARAGSGTAVAAGATFRPTTARGLPVFPPLGFGPFRTDIVDFRSGLPDLSRFPVRAWQRLTREVWARVGPRDLAYSQPEGREELRVAVAGYLAAHRGVRCHPGQVVITAGTTQAIGIAGRLLLRRAGDRCVLEDPITADIQSILRSAGAHILPVPVDAEGLTVGRLPRGGQPRFIYVTPSHQFPLGVTMPIQRRVALLEYARRTGAYVVEDDYDSEFRYETRPISSIQGLDPVRVLYVGTFSKTLCPSLRVGYLVLPPALVERGRKAKWYTDLHNASIDQLVLARFIAEGRYARHVARMKRVHSSLREQLVAALREALGGRVEILGSAAGLHLCARFAGVRFSPELLDRIVAAGVRVYPVEDHTIRKGRYKDTVILGYGMLSPDRIREGIRLLAGCLVERGAAPGAPVPPFSPVAAPGAP